MRVAEHTHLSETVDPAPARRGGGQVQLPVRLLRAHDCVDDREREHAGARLPVRERTHARGDRSARWRAVAAGAARRKTGSGGLVFRSREFADRSGTSFQIEIDLPHYRGIGSYDTAGLTLGPATVTAIGEFGTPGPTTVFHDPHGIVTVTTAHGSTLGGRLTAVFSGHHRFFRAYGAWRCTVLK